MSMLPGLDALVQQARGFVASIAGQTYNVCRLSPTTSGSLAAATPVLSGLQAEMVRNRSLTVIESQPFELVVYEAEVDNTLLQLGDLLIETGYKAQPASYAFAQARPPHPSLFVRTETPCQINRPLPEGGTEAQMPTTAVTSTFNPEYAGQTLLSAANLVLTAGQYYFTQNPYATPATVMCGVQPTSRTSPEGTALGLGTPTDEPRNRFAVYIPLLPGVTLRREDRLTSGDLDLQIVHLYSSGLVGLSGNIAIVDQLGV